MKFVEDKGGAIALMIVALIFLGTWPALLNLLERRGRNPVHTYLDYSLTNFLVAIIIAFTLGQIGAPKPGVPNFTTQLSQVDDQPNRQNCCTTLWMLCGCLPPRSNSRPDQKIASPVCRMVRFERSEHCRTTGRQSALL